MTSRQEYAKEYAKEYYKQNRTEIIKKQLAYHQEHRDKYLAYMREYNRQYYLKHRVLVPKKVKEPKPPKTPKPPKIPKPPKVPKPVLDESLLFFTPPTPASYTTRIERGQFTLDFS